MRAKPSSTNITTSHVAITSAFWPLLGGRLPRSKRSDSNALRSAIVFLLTVLAFTLSPASLSYAATLTVCASGCGYTTIASAISAASPGDTISVTDAVHTEANIVVDRNLTILGLGATNTAIDGGAAGSVFTINGGVTATIQDLTIRNGSVSATAGGGILNSGTLTITNSILSGNHTDLYGGGGIFNTGVITISNSTFSGNSSGGYGGGGIYNYGTVSISNSTFLDNNSVGESGGLYNGFGATATISNSTFSGNSTGGAGGGISNHGTVTLEDSTISGNSSLGPILAPIYVGGGVSNYDGTITIRNSTISNNFAIYGGGAIFNVNPGIVSISNSTLSGNSSTYYGGGISNYGGATVKNSIVANSSGSSDCYGGAPTALGANLDTDGSCGSANFTQVTSAQLSLGTLALNPPGTTETVALQSGSAAIDAAPDCTDVSGNPVTTDQRGVSRPDAGESACDIGAYEFVDAPLSKSDCKDGKWQLWTNPPFKNQGQCIKFVNHS